MNDHSRRPHGANGLPVWLTCTVVLVLLGDFTWNIVVVGPEAYPSNVIIGGLLGAYAGIDQLLRRKREREAEEREEDSRVDPPGGGTST